MAHYIGVFMPLESGGWQGFIPDLPACKANGDTLDLAAVHAAAVLAQHIVGVNGTAQQIPSPRHLVAVKADEDWAAAHGIDWSVAIVTMIPMHIGSLPS
jgi:predicted RNase H-like HicB family nuclease